MWDYHLYCNTAWEGRWFFFSEPFIPKWIWCFFLPIHPFLFSSNICFFCSSLSLFPFICHHWQLRENVFLLAVFSAERAFGSERWRQENLTGSFEELLETTWILFNLEDGWEASSSPGSRLQGPQQPRVLLPCSVPYVYGINASRLQSQGRRFHLCGM